jgi:hypothetical protein
LKLGGAQFFDETTAATPAIGNEQAAAAALQPLCAAGCDGILRKHVGMEVPFVSVDHQVDWKSHRIVGI